MKKVSKFIARFFIVWGAIGLSAIISYIMITYPVLLIYDKHGLWESVMTFGVLAVIYTALYYIVIGIVWLIFLAIE